MTTGKEHSVDGWKDMSVEEFYSGFNLDFLTEEEKQTIYTATELYTKGKVRGQSTQVNNGQAELERQLGYWRDQAIAAKSELENAYQLHAEALVMATKKFRSSKTEQREITNYNDVE